MNYFLISIGILSLIMIILIIIMLVLLWRNHKRKTKYAISYFLPVLVAVVCLIYIKEVIFPVYSDVVNAVNHNYIITTGEVEEVSSSKMNIVIDGELYNINPMGEEFHSGDIVKIKYTPNSKYIVNISLEKIEDVE